MRWLSNGPLGGGVWPWTISMKLQGGPIKPAGEIYNSIYYRGEITIGNLVNFGYFIGVIKTPSISSRGPPCVLVNKAFHLS